MRKLVGFALYGWSCFLLLVPFAWLGAVLMPNFRLRFKAIRTVARLFARTTRTPLDVVGSEHLSAIKGPCVIVVNHASYLDSFVLAAALPEPFRFVAKAEFSRRLMTRLPLERLQGEFVERFDTGKSVDDAARLLTALKSGTPLLFFAESTFTRVPGLQPFYMGAFKTAADAALPVVPVAIRGTRSILRDGSWFPHRGKITVTIGGIIDPMEIARESEKEQSWDVAVALRDSARSFILRHCGEPDLSRG